VHNGIHERSLSDGAEGDAAPCSTDPLTETRNPMPSTVLCPDCHRPATILGHFTTGGADNPSEFLRIRCTGLLTLLVPVGEATERVTDHAVSR
jgi:hypothetical protein